MNKIIDNLVATQPLEEILRAIADSVTARATSFQSKLDENDGDDSDLFEQSDSWLDVADSIRAIAGEADYGIAPTGDVETSAEAINDGLNEYVVPVSYSLAGTVTVRAENKAEALELADKCTESDADASYVDGSWLVDEFGEFADDEDNEN